MKKILVLGLGIFLIGCARQTFHSDLTVSTRVSSVRDYKILGDVQATACNKWIFFFGVGANYKSMYKTVLENASQMGGDALIDFQVRSKNFFYLYPLGVLDCWEATGTAIKMGKTGRFDSQSSAWDKPLESKKIERENPEPSRWDKPPK